MKRRNFTIQALFLFIALSVSCGAAERPNVLVIFTDDHRFSGVHALGGLQVQTPHMDRLADDGFTFTRAYLQGSMNPATCVPSRHMFLTGRGLFDLEDRGKTIPPSSTMMGEAFRQAGYETYHVGKWHNDAASLARSAGTGESVMGFAYLKDHYRMPLFEWDATGAYPREAAYLLTYADDGSITRRPLTDDDKRGATGNEADGPHSSESFAEGAIELIEQQDPEQPFFMYLAFHAPHDPRQAPEAYKALYPPESIKLPPSYLPQHPFDNGEMTIRDERLAPWPRTPEIARQELADYYAIITHLDAQIGRVVAALERSGQADNTIIVFAGDSGLGVGNHGLMGKQNLYDDDGIHVPLIFAGKVNEGGKRIPAYSYLHDVFPTICDLAGIDIPKSVTGKSLAPLIRGEVESVRDYTYHAYTNVMRAYRKDDFKLIEYFRAPNRRGEIKGSRVTQLFNLADDPWETMDLSFQKQYSARLEQMKNEMRYVAQEVGDEVTDVSYSGYQQSEEPIPFVRVVETLEPLPWDGEPEGTMAYPQGPDSRERIQAALDRVAALEPDENGFRGAVFLSKGTYYLSGGLHIKSGVVLRGEGRRNFGSLLVFNHPQGAGMTMGSERDDDEFSSMMGVEGLRITSNYDTAAVSQANSAGNPGAFHVAVPGKSDAFMRSTAAPKTPKGVTLTGHVSRSEPDEMPLAGNLDIGIRVLKSKNAWVRGVRVLHVSGTAVSVENSRQVTVRDSTSLEPISEVRGQDEAPFSSKDSSLILFYHCSSEEERHDAVIGGGFNQIAASPEESAVLFEEQLSKRIGERQSALVLAETLSKASLQMLVKFPRPVVDGVIQGPISKEQVAFEAADQRTWETVMADDGTGDWTEQWFLDGEGQSSVGNSPEGMELKALEGHMVLWTKESFEGDLKIEYTFTRTDNGGNVCIIYIQGSGRGDPGYETDITKWNDSRENANMGSYFSNMHLYHVSYACGYVRGRRYNPGGGGLNTFSELNPEYLVDNNDFFEIGVPYRITFIKSDREIRMRAVGPEKALYFMLDNEKWAPVTEGRIGLRQMHSRESIYKDFRVSVPGE